MMVDFKWIQIYLFLVAKLQFTAAAEQLRLSSTVRVGDEVTLPCKNVMDGQQNCDATTWISSFFRDTAAVSLVELGQIVERDKSKSDRLSVTENCSLVIKKVAVQDVGRYTCRQFNKSGQEQGSGSLVYLSVVTSEETTTATKPATPEPTTTDDPSTAPTGCSAVNYIMLVLRVAELVLITVITVLLIRAPGNQRPADDNTLSNPVRRPPVRRSGAAASQVNDDEDEDDGVVNYENSVRLR